MQSLYPNFTNQYNNTYKIRLVTLRPLISKPQSIDICNRIHDLNKQTEKCFIIGILFISSDLKTTIFDKLNTNKKKVEFKKSTYISKDIKYFVEDETGRIEIMLNSKQKDFLCTGMCLGFIGNLKNNIFNVEEIVFPNAPEKKETVLSTKKVIFVSGLFIANNKNLTGIKVITDYLFMHGIDELVIFGRFFDDDFNLFKKCLESLHSNIILIPEYRDFSCMSFPLLPVHKKLFKKNIISYSNPCIVDLCGKSVAFTSHKILQDLLKYIDQDIQGIQYEADGYRMHLKEEKMDTTPVHVQDFNTLNLLKVVKGLIRARLLAPNGPDTLSIIPYSESEVFFIDKKIEYFFVPNCDEQLFIKEDSTECIVVTIPNFHETKKVVVVDFKNNSAEYIEYTE
ncbi:dna polymerase delta regulatory subunit b [Vairimorpha ceranae]|uniref:Dna polymerase delta regulatory subunit b n=1 Tax=Vairimorpha ceranae TaxID=40302 RepID=A0A0F9ZC88_9MICR|nr:dna polymerase delta regulatory subunit b [Vairimorpha ceranae]KAF5140513.1 hypothetical protein G9O61_00g013180 [Vairimorpha ceranae]KKO75259.1 dna polymerase delta regulatory subunit b [Vairimorpha ceranae]